MGEFINLKKPKKINITGHSLGAALCAISCIDFTIDPIAKELPTYAVSVAMPPMVSRHFNKMVTRICPNFTSSLNHSWRSYICSQEVTDKILWIHLGGFTQLVYS